MSHNCLIEENIIELSSALGLYIQNSNSPRITSNIIRDNATTGIYPRLCSSPEISHNIIAGNFIGIFIRQDSETVIRNNTFYGENGINIRANTSGVTILNNVIWSVDGYCVYFGDNTPETKNYFSDFNNLYPTGTGIIGRWDNTDYPDLGSWIPGSGQDGHSISSNPRLADLSGGDFHLKSTEGDTRKETGQPTAKTAPA